MSDLTIESRGAVVLATIDRPGSYNALDAAIVAGLRTVVKEAESSLCGQGRQLAGSSTKISNARGGSNTIWLW